MSALTSRVAGAVGGVVLLGLMTLFAVGLPQWTDASASLPGQPEESQDTSSSGAPVGTIVLPDTLAGDYVAIDSDQVPPRLASKLPDPSEVAANFKKTAGDVGDLFGASAQIRLYINLPSRTFATVTVLDKEPGLFVPDGPPADPNSQQQSSYNLVKVGDAVCGEYVSQPTDAQGQPVQGAPVPSRAHCQVGVGGHTIDVDLDARATGFEVLPALIESLTT